MNRFRKSARAWIVSLVLLAGVLATYLLWERESVEPAPSVPGEDRKFVGTQTCATCHFDKAESWARTGHGRTFSLTSESAVARGMDGRVFEDPHRGFSYHYHFDRKDGLSVTIPEVFGERPFPLKYALGSNENAVTFVSLIEGPGEQPLGIEHRVSVFGDDGRLDLTPGQSTHQPQQDVELFGKIIEAETLTACIGCHTVTATFEATALRNVEPDVGCESCHGPGSRHVAAMEQGLDREAIDFGSLAAVGARRQIEMCGECHRLPEVLHPADVKADNEMLARFQPVGLLNSECFLKSENRLGCTTCHDPHRHAAENPEQYVESCLKCHGDEQSQSVSCPVSPRNDCIQCHMPRVEVHPGIQFHDHWIRVHDDQRPVADPQDR